MHRKIFVAGLTLLFLHNVAALDFDGSQSSSFTNNSVIDLEYSEKDLDGDINVTYYNGSSSIGQVNSSPFNLQFDSKIDSGNYQKLELEANATNGTDYNVRSANITVDREKPEVSGIDPTRFGNGTFLFESFSTSESGTSIINYSLVRRFNGSHTVDFSDSAKLYDENKDDEYGNFNYSVRAEDEAGNIGVRHLDANLTPQDDISPYLSSVTPESGEKINNRETQEFEAVVKDSLSGLSSVNVTLGNKESTFTGLSGNEKSISFNIEEFDDSETYEAVIDVEDQEGNSDTIKPNFTVDRYAPDLELEKNPDREFLTDSVDIGLDYISGDTSDLDKIECLVDGKNIGSDFKRNSDDFYLCGELDPADYDEGKITLEARITDDVGNTRTKEVGSWIIDRNPPEIDELEIVPEKGWKNPEIRIEASDEASFIREIHYRINEGEKEIIERSADLKGIDETFEPGFNDLPNGTYDVKVSVKDQAGRTSEESTVEYFYDTSSTPSISVEYSDFVTRSDLDGFYQYSIENEGDAGMISAKVSFSGAVEGSTEQFYLPVNQTKEFNTSLEPVKSFGKYNSTMEIKSETIDVSKSFETVLEASPQEVNKTDYDIRVLESRISDIENNITNLTSYTVRRSEIEKLMTQKRNLENSVYRLQDEVSRGNYYKAAERVPELKNETKKLSGKVQSTRKKYERLKKLLIGGGGGFLLLLIGFFYRNQDRTRRIEQIIKESFGAAYLFISNILSKIPGKNIFDGKYRDLRYGELGTKTVIMVYKIKRKIRKHLGSDGVEWKGYH